MSFLIAGDIKFHKIRYLIIVKFKWNITRLRIPNGRKQTFLLFTRVQIRLAVRAGPTLEASGLQVQHSNRSATLPPEMESN